MEKVEVVTIAEVALLTELCTAVVGGMRVRMQRGDRVFEGVLRYFTEEEFNGNHGNWQKGDIRDKWVRVSSGWEHWYTVRELLDGLRAGTVAFG